MESDGEYIGQLGLLEGEVQEQGVGGDGHGGYTGGGGGGEGEGVGGED